MVKWQTPKFKHLGPKFRNCFFFLSLVFVVYRQLQWRRASLRNLQCNDLCRIFQSDSQTWKEKCSTKKLANVFFPLRSVCVCRETIFHISPRDRDEAHITEMCVHFAFCGSEKNKYDSSLKRTAYVLIFSRSRRVDFQLYSEYILDIFCDG